MSEALSSAEINRQHAELLPARTVLSLFSTQPPSGAGGGTGGGAKPINIQDLSDSVASAGGGLGGRGDSIGGSGDGAG